MREKNAADISLLLLSVVLAGAKGPCDRTAGQVRTRRLLSR